MLSPFVKERFEGPGFVLCKHTTGGKQQIIGAMVDQEKANVIHNEPEELIVEILQFLVSTEKVDTHNMGCSEKAQAMRECIERAYKTISLADLVARQDRCSPMDDGTLQSLWSICPITSHAVLSSANVSTYMSEHLPTSLQHIETAGSSARAAAPKDRVNQLFAGKGYMKTIFRKVYKKALLAARCDWNNMVNPKSAMLVLPTAMPEPVKQPLEILRARFHYKACRLHLDEKYDPSSAEPNYAEKEFQMVDLPVFVLKKIYATVKSHIQCKISGLTKVLDCISNDESFKSEVREKARLIGFKLCLEKFEVKMSDGQLLKMQTFLESDADELAEVVDVVGSGQSITQGFGNNAKKFKDIQFQFDRQEPTGYELVAAVQGLLTKTPNATL
jgi:hypothetical protein